MPGRNQNDAFASRGLSCHGLNTMGLTGTLGVSCLTVRYVTSILKYSRNILREVESWVGISDLPCGTYEGAVPNNQVTPFELIRSIPGRLQKQVGERRYRYGRNGLSAHNRNISERCDRFPIRPFRSFRLRTSLWVFRVG